jgi:hypothetical protein
MIADFFQNRCRLGPDTRLREALSSTLTGHFYLGEMGHLSFAITLTLDKLGLFVECFCSSRVLR